MWIEYMLRTALSFVLTFIWMWDIYQQKDIMVRRLQKIELMGTSSRLSHMVETIYIFLRVMTNELMNLSQGL